MVGRSVGVAVPAAGGGRRLGGMKKAFLEVAGEPLLVHALQPFLAHPEVEAVVVALPPADVDGATEWLTRLDARIRVVPGGSTRMRSVHGALRALPPSVDVVLVHDAARPLVEREIIDRCLAGVREGEGAVAGWPSTDTLKEVDGDGRVLSTPSRSSFWRAQTPQGFPREMLLSAYAEAET
ncbi:MAG: IspD/TarI family cytidylyltransferase, partial [bacterium]